jgi:hypothetical protein
MAESTSFNQDNLVKIAKALKMGRVRKKAAGKASTTATTVELS